MAERVAQLVLEDAWVRGVEITVHKPEAPISVPFSDVSVTVRRGAERAAVALGSNLGDRAATLRSALAALAYLGELVAVSGFHETAPVGVPEQGDFLNVVVVFETDLTPEQLLARMQAVEDDHGRVRVEWWGPRTLDLDLVVMEGMRRDSTELTLPHPRAAERRFVLVPLVEVWPDAEVAPGLTASEALDRLGASEG